MRLTVELVPKTAWWSNVRSNVNRVEWEQCKAYARAKTGGTCIICGDSGLNQGYRYPVEAHEIWDYDDHNQIQTLVDIWPLCPMCHKVKHLGRTREVSSPEQWARVIDHLARVNRWTGSTVERYVLLVFEIWRERSTVDWRLNIDMLTKVGIDISNRTLERP